jgi:PadR family transcriptional regulator PadR
MKALGEFEQLILFAVLKLDGEAYGVRIRQEIEGRTGREVSAGAIYTTLERLENRGYVVGRRDQESRGRGRPRCYYSLQPGGVAELHRSYSQLKDMARGLGSKLEELARTGNGTTP